MQIKPIYDRILIQRLDEEVTSGGILIPQTVDEKPNKGKVIAVGSGRLCDDGTLVPLVVKEGDLILYSKFAGNGTEVKINNVEHILIKETDVLAITTEDQGE